VSQPESTKAGAPPGRRGLLARFSRSRKGVVAVEFAMVAIPFLGLLCAIFETALVFFTQEAFSDAVATVARQVLTNQSQTSGTSQTISSFMTNSNFCQQLPSIIDCSKVALNVQAYDPKTYDFSQVTANNAWYDPTKYNPSSTMANLGNPGDIVVFQAYYPMPVYLSVLVATGTNGASNLWSDLANKDAQTQQNSNSTSENYGTVYKNPSGAGFIHAIFSTVVFRNEP
jgi:Flp pilus assembly protein TadG